MIDSPNTTLVKDILIGTAGGLAGTAAMYAYWKAVTEISGEDPRTRTRKTNGSASSIAILGTHHKEGESSTEALARLGYEAVEHREPDEDLRHQLSNLVHWTYGAAQGALFDTLARRLPGPRWVRGLTYGAGMWLLGDEIAVSALGLADGPRTFPVRQHAHRLGAHLAYGLAAALATSALHRMIGD